MIAKTSKLTRMALSAAAVLCLGATAMAGPDPMYIMLNGKMMKVTPMTRDVTMKNGCKVCCVGTYTDAKGKTVYLKSGDMVSTEGMLMKPYARSLHGGGQ
ncbi:hypothetical protein CfE428DRAFT_4037 [Chthoniobacter flavus Ellin428]|uniref:DUF6799 domain-containing protein n=1 Tax=Chthoniobacter flavus Ellin428 TaxID=497964 RepID=B4D548_9BACT|nr:DUF6799 domain-containing protein [Chthoniobacter flavus]EDY18253.1 hypothetical protein CfE428DRAFT_4037 [Chthoniobacter flavus Ellin428]TCO91283.1 hypothetical protein EV701_1088 [Chthoniobacter flavus]